MQLYEILSFQIIASSRKLPSTKTRYIAARFTQDYFEPAGTSSRDFILGGNNVVTSLIPTSPTYNVDSKRVKRSPGVVKGKVYSANSQQNWLLNDVGSLDETSAAANAYLDAAVVFDNKPLEAGQVYCVSYKLFLAVKIHFITSWKANWCSDISYFAVKFALD